MWRSSYLFLKKPITLVIFRGGGPDLLTPHLSMDSEIKRIGRNDRYSQIYGCSIVQVDITTCYSVMFYSGQNSSITKDDNF